MEYANAFTSKTTKLEKKKENKYKNRTIANCKHVLMSKTQYQVFAITNKQ